MKKSKKKTVIILITLIAIIIFIFVNYKLGNEFIVGIYKNTIGRIIEKHENTTLTCVVYDNQDSNSLKTLLTIDNASGIDYIVKPDGMKILAYGKRRIAIDYNTGMNIENTFEIKPIDSEKIEKTIIITEDDIKNQFRIEKIDEYTGKVTYDMQNSTDKTYYKGGNNSESQWTQYTNDIQLEGINFNIEQFPDISRYGSFEANESELDLKKIDKTGNAVTVYGVGDYILKTAKLELDVFRYAQYKGDSLGNYFTLTYASPANEYAAFTYNNISYGHYNLRPSVKAIYELNCSNLVINRASKLYVEFELRAESSDRINNGYLQASAKLQYADGTQSETKTTAQYKGAWMSFPLEINLNIQKSINKVIFTIEGVDPDYGSCQGRIKNVKFISTNAEISEKTQEEITAEP